MVRAVLVVAAALITAACGSLSSAPSTVTVTTAPPSSATATATVSLDQWGRDDLAPVMDKLGDALTWAGGAMGSMDLADTRAAARSLDKAIDDLEATLPSPDDSVDADIRTAVEHFRKFARGLMGLNPSMTRGDIAELQDQQDAGMDAMRRAMATIKP